MRDCQPPCTRTATRSTGWLSWKSVDRSLGSPSQKVSYRGIFLYICVQEYLCAARPYIQQKEVTATDIINTLITSFRCTLAAVHQSPRRYTGTLHLNVTCVVCGGGIIVEQRVHINKSSIVLSSRNPIKEFLTNRHKP